jgi:hypothetical protein
MKDVLRRTVLVITPDRKLAYRWDVPDPPRIPTVDEIIVAVREALAVA